LFLFGALRGFLKQADIVDRQTRLNSYLRNQVFIDFVNLALTFTGDRDLSDFLSPQSDGNDRSIFGISGWFFGAQSQWGVGKHAALSLQLLIPDIPGSEG